MRSNAFTEMSGALWFIALLLLVQTCRGCAGCGGDQAAYDHGVDHGRAVEACESLCLYDLGRDGYTWTVEAGCNCAPDRGPWGDWQHAPPGYLEAWGVSDG